MRNLYLRKVFNGTEYFISYSGDKVRRVVGINNGKVTFDRTTKYITDEIQVDRDNILMYLTIIKNGEVIASKDCTDGTKIIYNQSSDVNYDDVVKG